MNMVRTLVVDFTHTPQEPHYCFDADVLGGCLLKVAFKDALASPWVSTASALPYEGQLVVVSGGMVLDTAYYLDGQFHVGDVVYPPSSLEYWMLVPETPEDEY
ncbi:hypothetical protein JRC42_19620 [Escherichia albertii]|uniref:hypothetical protein n=1 Tax=Escherichia albertii TaxID=208962 RepID=UPI00195ECBDB|nr:hypothetical protein [Escherichia albertii]QST27748.1 hypothetical protein JRC42_19620 [Escherichia albertii]QST37115.1 hypothetical protein JRC46_19620 [Escherichia albertii]